LKSRTRITLIVVIIVVAAIAILLAFLPAILVLVGPGGSRPLKELTGPVYVATIPPVAAILTEVVGDRGDVISLLQPGESPHTYEPRPSGMATVENSEGLFYVDDAMDGWVSTFSDIPKISLFQMVPDSMRLPMPEGHSHGNDEHAHQYDPHFWTSPLVVKAILPSLVDALTEVDPEGAEMFQSNADAFAARLDALDAGVSEMLSPYEGQSLILFHPSFGYFLNQYNLELAGTIEPSPGQEPSPAHIIELAHIAQEQHVRAIFTEPQLPVAPARTLAEETGLPIYTLDPLGGLEGRKTYGELIRYNAQEISRALGGE
jgi:ABC-type Zn uptake system ZnuABC Zn-binding protein ZnuA